MATPETRSIRFECAHLPLSFHSFGASNRDPFTILAYKTSRRWFRTYCIPNSHSYIRSHFACPRLRTLYLSRHSRSDKRTMVKIHEKSEGVEIKRKSLKRTASGRRSVPRTPMAHSGFQIPSPDPSPIPTGAPPHSPHERNSSLLDFRSPLRVVHPTPRSPRDRKSPLGKILSAYDVLRCDSCLGTTLKEAQIPPGRVAIDRGAVGPTA